MNKISKPKKELETKKEDVTVDKEEGISEIFNKFFIEKIERPKNNTDKNTLQDDVKHKSHRLITSFTKKNSCFIWEFMTIVNRVR